MTLRFENNDLCVGVRLGGRWGVPEIDAGPCEAKLAAYRIGAELGVDESSIESAPPEQVPAVYRHVLETIDFGGLGED